MLTVQLSTYGVVQVHVFFFTINTSRELVVTLHGYGEDREREVQITQPPYQVGVVSVPLKGTSSELKRRGSRRGRGRRRGGCLETVFFSSRSESTHTNWDIQVVRKFKTH